MKFQFLKLGADVECFFTKPVKDSKEKEIYFPACGLLGGTKENPLPVLGGNGFAVQEDNVSVEFNVPAASKIDDWVSSFYHMRDHLYGWALGLRGSINFVPIACFDEKLLETEQAQRFGCDPDYNVYLQDQNPDIDRSNPVLKTSRFAGGHVHISFLQDGEKPNIRGMEVIVRACDAFLGVPFMFVGEALSELQRREFYGRAGSFRPKMEYGGIEYRALSGVWASSDSQVGFIWSQVQTMFKKLNNENWTQEVLIPLERYCERAINEGDMSSGRVVLQELALDLAHLPR